MGQVFLINFIYTIEAMAIGFVLVILVLMPALIFIIGLLCRDLKWYIRLTMVTIGFILFCTVFAGLATLGLTSI